MKKSVFFCGSCRDHGIQHDDFDGACGGKGGCNRKQRDGSDGKTLPCRSC